MTTTCALWDRERGLGTEDAENYRDAVHAFISDRSQCMAYLMTRRRDGRPIMRPVGTFLEGWCVSTMTQDIQPKTEHIRRDPVVGYLWVGKEGRPDWPQRWNPHVVWMQGRAELIEDQDKVAAFYERRAAAGGSPRGHPPEEELYVIRVTPEYVRAEGWHGSNAIVLRDFD